jgi:glycosyltransferase involved in cell wall biosynthesis
MENGINKRVLVIVPCYNEAQNVKDLFNDLKSIAVEGCSIFPLFINDNSSDNTQKVLSELGAHFLDNVVNLGIGGTVQLGFIYAYGNGFDFAVQMDGDGQHPPRELQKLIEVLLKEEADVVIGSRFMDNKGFRSTYARRLGIQFFSALNRFLVKVDIKDPTSGFRAYNKNALVELIHYYPDEYPEPEAIVYLAHKNMRIKEVSVEMEERQGGKSSIRHFTTVYYMAKVTLNSIVLHFKMKLHAKTGNL